MDIKDAVVGQKVKAVDISSQRWCPANGHTGVIRDIEICDPSTKLAWIGVEIDDPGFKGHNLEGQIRSGRGYYFRPENVELYSEGFGKVGAARPLLPTEAAERKKFPIATGVLDYFPSALLEVARVSYVGNEQHNPGQPLHWARGKSMDQADTTLRHLMEGLERGASGELHLTKDGDGTYHLAKGCWRLLALLQEGLEKEGAPLARGARMPVEVKK